MTAFAAPCAVFDLDGTLAHTAPDLVAAANAMLAEENLPPMPVSAAEKTAGFGGKALLRKGFELAGRPIDESVVDRLYAPFLLHYENYICDDSHLYPDVVTVLDELTDKGWKIAICTNKPERLARILMERLEILDRFGALIGADTLPVRKPDPAPMLAAIARAGGSAEHAVMIGDTETDLKTARAVGAPCVMTSFGYSPVAAKSLGPDAVIDAFHELPDVLNTVLPRRISA